MKLDEIDIKILEVLKRNSKLSYRELGKKLLMPVTTVHHRIRKLEKNGVIKNYSLVIDNKQLGKTISSYILLKVDYVSLKHMNLSQQQLARKIKNNQNVEDIALITGLKDIIIKVRCSSIAELNNLITKDLRNLQGIKSTETLIVLDELD